MGKINLGRVVLGGIVAGIVTDALGYLVDNVWLAPRWAAGMKALGHGEFTGSMEISFVTLGIVCGILTILLYASIRTRFGAGVNTAIFAGLLVWAIGTLLPNLGFMWVSGLFPHHLMVYTTFGGLIETVAGTIAGAWLYKE
jgi:hypothetical protein